MEINFCNEDFYYGKANTALLRAIKNRNIKVVEILLKSEKLDVNISHKGFNALYLAKSNLQVFQLLLSHEKIDVNKKNEFGYPLLHQISDIDQTKQFQLLMEREDIDAN